MKTLTYTQLKEWNPCNGHDWLGEFKEKYGKSALMSVVEKELVKRKECNALNWLVGKRLEKLSKRQVCMFAYRCSRRALQYARKEDLPVLKKAIGFAKQFADTGTVDRSAAWAARDAASAARDAASAAAWAASAAASAAARAVWAVWAAWSASAAASAAARDAASAAEYKWQLKQLNEIEDSL